MTILTNASIFSVLAYHAFLVDNETADENAFLDDFHFQSGVLEDAEISKKQLDSASDTFSKLGKFITLSKAPPPKKRRSRGWGGGWGRRRRRSSPVPGNLLFKNLFVYIYNRPVNPKKTGTINSAERRTKLNCF